MKRILTLSGDNVYVNGIIVCSNSEELAIWRVLKSLNPLLWMLQLGDTVAEVGFLKDMDISLIVGNSDVLVKG
jgi:hypothetical protein